MRLKWELYILTMKKESRLVMCVCIHMFNIRSLEKSSTTVFQKLWETFLIMEVCFSKVLKRWFSKVLKNCRSKVLKIVFTNIGKCVAAFTPIKTIEGEQKDRKNQARVHSLELLCCRWPKNTINDVDPCLGFCGFFLCLGLSLQLKSAQPQPARSAFL